MEDVMANSTRPKTSNARQGDLLSDQWSSKPPRRGAGRHIRLKALGNDQGVVVPGMAGFSGGGPVGTYCRDCNHFGEKIAVQKGIDAIEKTRDGCVVWASRMGHAAPLPRHDIRLCCSCKHFEAADASPRFFVIDMAGEVHRLTTMPENLQSWLRDRS
jgi:hypothetical protein